MSEFLAKDQCFARSVETDEPLPRCKAYPHCPCGGPENYASVGGYNVPLSSNERVYRVLRAVITIPAVRQAVGTSHTDDCGCPICEAWFLLNERQRHAVGDPDAN